MRGSREGRRALKVELHNGRVIEADPVRRGKPLDHFDMLAFHGSTAEKTCGGCRFLQEYTPGNGTFFKCGYANPTGGAATDWRKKWAACGLFEAIA